MKDMIDKKYELSLLYDFYGELLKEHNRLIFEDYYLNDLSLSEIADSQGISRQGVHDIIRRTSRQLEEYEKKLKLREKYFRLKSETTKAIELIKEIRDTKELDKLTQLESILIDIEKEY